MSIYLCTVWYLSCGVCVRALVARPWSRFFRFSGSTTRYCPSSFSPHPPLIHPRPVRHPGHGHPHLTCPHSQTLYLHSLLLHDENMLSSRTALLIPKRSMAHELLLLHGIVCARTCACTVCVCGVGCMCMCTRGGTNLPICTVGQV